MSIILDGTGGVTTPGVVNTAGETIATTLSVTGVATLGAGAVLGTPASGNLANCTGVPTPAALSTATGSAPSYSCRAWVNFNGTGTVAIRASGNVSSITDNGTGDYTVNFTTALVDANYSTTGAAGVSGTGTGLMGSWFTANRDQTTGSTVNPTTSAVRVGALTSSPSPSAVDVPHMLVAIFR